MEPEKPEDAHPRTVPLHYSPDFSRETDGLGNTHAEISDPGISWIFLGPGGLRAGWSILAAYALFRSIRSGLIFLMLRVGLYDRFHQLAPRQQILSALLPAVALLASMSLVSVAERRRLLDYNLRDRRWLRHFASGLGAGFAALSALVGSLAWGGWLRFGPVSLAGSEILRYAVVWGSVFFLVGCFEEGSMRCYLQYTFTRSLNFWWAAGIIGCLCAWLAWNASGNGVWGVYILALLGLIPCLLLHSGKSPHAAFWQAAWVTSTIFGGIHTGNNGENWVGIFAAGFIGLVFCVSVWATGSAWWAIGAHAAWDWAETYFYGTADSGFVAPGHLLSTSSAGKAMWSGGSDGPEGSLLVIPIIILLLGWLLVVYRRPQPQQISPAESGRQLAS